MYICVCFIRNVSNIQQVGAWIVVWMGGSVGQWMGSGHIAKYRINLDLIEIIQFCLKIFDLLRHPHLLVGVWVNGWGQVK